MKNIKKIIGSVLLAAAFTATSVGTTFALFTDEAKTTINVESGKIDLKSALTIAEVKSLNDSTIDTHTVVTDSKHAAYENGGSVAITSDALTGSETVAINYWTPGDSVKLLATPDNTGTNIKTLIRLQVTMSGELAPALTVKGFAGDATTPSLGLTGVKTVFSGWTPVGAGENPSAYYLEIAFPNHGYEITPREQGIDNQYQDKQATIVVSYQAVQGNAAVNDVLERANSLLALHEVNTGSRYATMHDALEGIKSNFSAAELEILAQYVWGSQEDQFYVASTENSNHNYFKQYSAMPAEQTYSIYATGANWGNVSGLTVGFDAGSVTTIENIEYNRASASQGREVIIRTNGGTLTINAPLDTVHHYGDADIVNLNAVSGNSFYENGATKLVDVKKGRLVITNTAEAEVGTIYLSATDDHYDEIILATQDEAKLPSIVAREEVSLPENAGDKKLVVTIQQVDEAGVADADKTEEIYLYGASDVKEQEKGYDVSDMGLLVVEAISSEAVAEAVETLTEKGVEAEVINAVKEEKTAKVEDVINTNVLFDGGTGTENDPYMIGTAKHWNNLYQVTYDFNKESKVPYFKLKADINFAGLDINNFAVDGEIRELDLWMNCVIDGNNHALSNIESLKGYGQLFPNLSNATIKNIAIGYNLNEARTIATAYATEGNVYFTNVTVNGKMITSANWSTAFVAYSRNGNIYYTNCRNNATLKGSFGTDGYVAPFGSHNGGGVHITFDRCTNYGEIYGSHAGFVGMGNDTAYTFVDSDAVKNYGSMYGFAAGYFNYNSTAASKTIGGVKCDVKQESASLSNPGKHTNTAPENYGHKIYIDEVQGAAYYQIEMRFAIGVYNYNGSYANKWGGGFPRGFTLTFNSDALVDGRIDTGLYKAYICESQQESYKGYGSTTPEYTGIWTPAGFDEEMVKYFAGEESEVTVLGGNNEDVFLVEFKGNIFYYYNDPDWPQWYALLTSEAQENPDTKGLTITYAITAFDEDGVVLSQATLSDTFTATEAREALDSYPPNVHGGGEGMQESEEEN